MIIPHLRFSCNGRITSIKAKVNKSGNPFSHLSFQVWRPSSANSSVYNKTGEVHWSLLKEVTKSIIIIKPTDNNKTEFQTGDIIGYYHPCTSRYLVAYINSTDEYELYQFDEPLKDSAAVNIDEATEVIKQKQPLLKFTVGMNQLCM